MSEKSNSSTDATKKIDLKNTPSKKPTVNKTSTTKVGEKKEDTHKAKKKKPAKKRNIVGSIFHGIFSVTGNIFMLILLVGFIGMAYVSNYVLNIVEEIPAIDPSTIAESLSENSIIVDKNGNILETLYGDAGMRTKVPYEDIGQNMINAIVAIEDKTFFEHTGFNYTRLIGAAYQSIKTGNDARGTSSITQQLAKNLYLTNEVALERKVKEAYYAILLERTLTKEQILWAYLNKIALGMNANGVQAASQLYFSKDAKDLNMVESVMLAGIPKSPAAYAPMTRLLKEDVREDHVIIDDSDETYTLVYNTECRDRYEFVLEQMKNNDMITAVEQESLLQENLLDYIHPTIDQSNLITSFFGDMVKDDAANALAKALNVTPEEAEKMLYNRGYIIESTIDFELQSKLEDLYNGVLMTNDYDSATYAAVKKFQELNGLSVDGSAGPNTLKTLIEQTSLTPEDFSMQQYTSGYKHDDVIKLKEGLSELGLYKNEGMFPRPTVIFDNEGNIINDVTGKIELVPYDHMIDENKNLVIKKENYYYDANDDLVLIPDKGLKFWDNSTGIRVEMNDLFTYDEGSEQATTIDGQRFYMISGMMKYSTGDVAFPLEHLSVSGRSLVIDKMFFVDYPDFFEKTDNGDLLIDRSKFYFVDRGVIQPQSAFVLMDHHTGEIKAIIGGREAEGQNIFNRALSPQQPGSSIKPIGPYTVAIASKQLTAATVFDDVPSFLNDKAPDQRWPFNWYETNEFKYRGRMNLRAGIEYSVNVLAVKVAQTVGVQPIIDHLKNLGITSIQETGPKNDLNLASVSLGGMTQGISPLELTAAYATYANQGVYTKPITFTKITDLSGNIIVENKPEKHVVLDEQVAYIIQDMMVDAVTTGVSNKANFPGMSVAGKTGTTSDKRDAVFVGYTPYYTAAIWMGNDVKLKMEEGSVAAAKFWSTIMAEFHKDLEDIGFVEPEGIQRVAVDRVSGKRPSELSALDPAGSQVYEELFIPGTAPTEIDDAHVEVTICLDNPEHVLATEYCPNTQTVVLRTRLEEYNPEEVLDKNGNPILPMDYIYTVPYKTCDIHTSETIEVDGKAADVIKNIDGEIIFIRDYNLLLKDGTFKFIPSGSKVHNLNYTITFPSGEEVAGDLYEVKYITRPETQIQAIYEMTQDAQNETPPDETQNPNE
ncbi:MAG: transglycosylase domain-containing protein [Clostridia bacterium]|nr:transglycosylase domain-containing protein [Clostridia bacterium]